MTPPAALKATQPQSYLRTTGRLISNACTPLDELEQRAYLSITICSYMQTSVAIAQRTPILLFQVDEYLFTIANDYAEHIPANTGLYSSIC
jgi:hypothetical protein